MKSKCLRALALLALSVAPAAYSQTIVQNLDFSITPTIGGGSNVPNPAGGIVTVYTDVLGFTAFNPALGTLQSVELSFSGTQAVELTLERLGSGFPFIDYSFNVDPVFLVLVDDELFDNSQDTLSGIAPSVGMFPSVYTENFDFDLAAFGTIALDPADFLDFNGSTEIGFGLAGSFQSTDDGVLARTDQNTALGTAQLVYTYAPIPEPSVIVLVLAAIPLLAVLWRRRR